MNFDLSKSIFVSWSLGFPQRKPYECESDTAADIMLLVDGSWSIGRTNFRRVRDFLEGLVTPFNIGPNHIQIGEDQANSGNQLVLYLKLDPLKERKIWQILVYCVLQG